MRPLRMQMTRGDSYLRPRKKRSAWLQKCRTPNSTWRSKCHATMTWNGNREGKQALPYFVTLAGMVLYNSCLEKMKDVEYVWENEVHLFMIIEWSGTFISCLKIIWKIEICGNYKDLRDSGRSEFLSFSVVLNVFVHLLKKLELDQEFQFGACWKVNRVL